MHQTFYIDIDEEITSIVDRLRKSTAKEIIIVVPKRAMLIQSVVNLKLLKKEADKMDKQVVIVTQDKLGKLLIEKTGILVQPKLDDIDGEEIITNSDDEEPENIADNIMNSYIDNRQPQPNKNNKLEAIGSAEYFDASATVKKNPVQYQKISKAEAYGQKAAIVNKELVTADASNNLSKVGRRSALDMVRKIEANTISVKKPEPGYPAGYPESFFRDPTDKTEAKFPAATASGSKFGNFFQSQDSLKPAAASNMDTAETEKSAGKFKKFLIGFVALIFLAAAIAAVGIFIFRADLTIEAKGKAETLNFEIKAETAQQEIDLENRIIPARLVSESVEISQQFTVTGSKTAATQKAHGTITIYNEFNESLQVLVATTRFESADGKIFRLSKAVTVPGMSKVGSELKPGAIEAEVTADEAGEAYNIGPGQFTIPGFKSSADKYAKFYAKSFRAMTGGGSGNYAKSVSKEDMEKAKSKLAGEIDGALKQKIEDSLSDGEVVLGGAINMEDASYLPSSAEGDPADNFTLTVQVKGNALVFLKQDVAAIAKAEAAQKNGANQSQISDENINLDFSGVAADLAKNSLKFTADSLVKIDPEVDVDSIRREITGKSENDLKKVLVNYPAVQNINIVYYPPFPVGRMPWLEKNIKIRLDKTF